MDQKKIGSLIKKLRIDNNLTQKEFALKYNVSFQAVSKWERGYNLPDIYLLKTEDGYVSKDKIKEKIEVLRMKEHYDYIDNKKEIQVLQELLEKEG